MLWALYSKTIKAPSLDKYIKVTNLGMLQIDHIKCHGERKLMMVRTQCKSLPYGTLR